MQNINIEVKMDSRSLRGTFALQDGKRLLDFLNERYPGSGEMEISPFITLNDVKIFHKDGKEETAGTVYLNRQAINTLQTFGENDARGIAVQNKKFPYVSKMPVKAVIYTPDSELTGYLHCREKQDIANMLSLRKPFIPCTDVNIHDNQLNSDAHAAFAAVNSNLVVAVKAANSL
jgi:hypothetical protein